MTKKLHKLHWDNYYESELVSIVWLTLFVYVYTRGCVVPVSVFVCLFVFFVLFFCLSAFSEVD